MEDYVNSAVASAMPFQRTVADRFHSRILTEEGRQVERLKWEALDCGMVSLVSMEGRHPY